MTGEGFFSFFFWFAYVRRFVEPVEALIRKTNEVLVSFCRFLLHWKTCGDGTGYLLYLVWSCHHHPFPKLHTLIHTDSDNVEYEAGFGQPGCWSEFWLNTLLQSHRLVQTRHSFKLKLYICLGLLFYSSLETMLCPWSGEVSVRKIKHCLAWNTLVLVIEAGDWSDFL